MKLTISIILLSTAIALTGCGKKGPTTTASYNGTPDPVFGDEFPNGVWEEISQYDFPSAKYALEFRHRVWVIDKSSVVSYRLSGDQTCVEKSYGIREVDNNGEPLNTPHFNINGYSVEMYGNFGEGAMAYAISGGNGLEQNGLDSTFSRLYYIGPKTSETITNIEDTISRQPSGAEVINIGINNLANLRPRAGMQICAPNHVNDVDKMPLDELNAWAADIDLEAMFSRMARYRYSVIELKSIARFVIDGGVLEWGNTLRPAADF